MRAAFFLVALLFFSACREPETTSDAAVSTARTYEVRGLVRQLPSGPGTELMIYHEEIPDLVDDRGEMVGMEAMTMSFPIADEALLEGIELGDRVAFSLRLDWEGSPALEITHIEALPPDVRLEFEAPEEGSEP